MLASLRNFAVCAAAAAALSLAGSSAQAYTVHGGYHIMPTKQYLEKHKHEIPPPNGQVVHSGLSSQSNCRNV